MEAQSLVGPTGNINTISTKTLSYKQWSAGLHRFFTGLNYGIYPKMEAGVSFDLKNISSFSSFDQENIDRKTKEISFSSKYRILREEDYYSPLDITLAQKRGTLLLIFGKFFEQYKNSTVQGGLSWEGSKFLTFFCYSQMKSTEQFIIDYDPENNFYNVGWRFLLSPEMKLDFFLVDFMNIRNIFFDNFVFGITLAG
jgi:hypothetical protein